MVANNSTQRAHRAMSKIGELVIHRRVAHNAEHVQARHNPESQLPGAVFQRRELHILTQSAQELRDRVEVAREVQSRAVGRLCERLLGDSRRQVRLLASHWQILRLATARVAHRVERPAHVDTLRLGRFDSIRRIQDHLRVENDLGR